MRGPHTNTTHAQGTRATGPGRPQGEGKRLKPDTPLNAERSHWKTLRRHPRGAQPPTGHTREGDSAGTPRPHSGAQHTWATGPDCPTAGGRAPNPRPPSQRHEVPPRQPTPPSILAERAVTEHPHPRRPHPGRMGANCPPKGRTAGQGERPTPDAPRTSGRPGRPPHKPLAGGGRRPDAKRPSQPRGHQAPTGARARCRVEPGEQRSAPAREGVRCGANVSLPHQHPTTPKARSAKRAATGAGQPQEVRNPSPALRHSNTAMAEPTAPRKTCPRSPTLDAAHEVIRMLGLRGGDGDPPQGTRTRTLTCR